MTVIAYRDGVIAADSRSTVGNGEPVRVHKCQKLFRKKTKNGTEVVIATAGENGPGLVFVDWYGTGKKPPLKLLDGEADFACLVLSKDGLVEYDKWCRGEPVEDEFYAIGCGAAAALGAMHAGATAEQAVEIACRIDPYCAPPIVAVTLAQLQHRGALPAPAVGAIDPSLDHGLSPNDVVDMELHPNRQTKPSVAKLSARS